MALVDEYPFGVDEVCAAANELFVLKTAGYRCAVFKCPTVSVRGRVCELHDVCIHVEWIDVSNIDPVISDLPGIAAKEDVSDRSG